MLAMEKYQKFGNTRVQYIYVVYYFGEFGHFELEK